MKKPVHDLPLVSVCIPNFNKVRFIEETIKSVFDQAYRNIEIIVVDDCSTDNSLEIIEHSRMSSPFPFHVIRNAVNMGVSFSSNVGAKLATGQYFQILSSDDIILSDKIGSQVLLLEQNKDLAGVYGNVQCIDETSVLINKDYFFDIGWSRPCPSGNIFADLLEKNFVPAPSTLLRTAFIHEVGGYDIDLRLEDWDMMLSLSEKYPINYTNQTYALYRVEQNSLMRSSKSKAAMFDAMCRTLFKRIGKSEKTDLIIRRNISNYARHIYESGGSSSKRWMNLGLSQKKDMKFLLFYLSAQIGIPYSFYGKIKRLYG